MFSTRRAPVPDLFRDCTLSGFDELFAVSGQPRTHYAPLYSRLCTLGADDLEQRTRLADRMMRTQGITFTVYGRGRGVERIMPFDPVPRIVPADEWDRIERGLSQRVRALNLVVHDVYHERRILRDGRVPPELVLTANSRPHSKPRKPGAFSAAAEPAAAIWLDHYFFIQAAISSIADFAT